MAYISNGDIYSSEFTDISDWVDSDQSPSESTQVTFDGKSCMKLDSSSTTQKTARRDKDVGTFGTRTIFSMNVYCETLGTNANNDYFEFVAYNGSYGIHLYFASDGLFVYRDATSDKTTEVGTDLVTRDTWQEWTFDVDWTNRTFDTYLNETLVSSDTDFSTAVPLANGQLYLLTVNYTTPSILAYIDWLKVGSAFTSIKSFNGVAHSSIKKVSNVVIASVNKIMGLA